MSLLQKIKNIIGTYLLKKTASQKKRRAFLKKFDDIEDIGIVYNAAKKADESIIHNFAAGLRLQGKKVYLLGYVDQKILPHTKKFHITSEFFWHEKLNFFNLPVKSEIGKFINSEFDLLLNIHFDSTLPMLAIPVYANAKYCMGTCVVDALSYFDAIIDTGENTSLQFLANQMEHYLKVIKH